MPGIMCVLYPKETWRISNARRSPQKGTAARNCLILVKTTASKEQQRMRNRLFAGFLVENAKRKVAAIAVAMILGWSQAATTARAAEAEKLNVFYSSIA